MGRADDGGRTSWVDGLDGKRKIDHHANHKATFPLDVVKTRMQCTPWSGHEMTRSLSPRSIVLDAIRNEGWKVMFAGLGPTLIR